MSKSIVVKKNNGGTIAQNKRARHDYFIEEKFEAGLSLQGWEVKSLRAGRMTITESYIFLEITKHFCLGRRFNRYSLHLRMWFLKQLVHVSYCFRVVNLKS